MLASYGVAYNNGGAGYILNAPAVKLLYYGLTSGHCFADESVSIEDVMVGLCLSKFGVLPFDTRDYSSSDGTSNSGASGSSGTTSSSANIHTGNGNDDGNTNDDNSGSNKEYTVEGFDLLSSGNNNSGRERFHWFNPDEEFTATDLTYR